MRAIPILFLLFSAVSLAQDRKVYTTTPAYAEIVGAYEAFAKQSDACRLLTYGTTDAGKPLHLFVISKTKEFDPVKLRAAGKRVFLINNGIHPGEPDGIDASIELVNTFLKEPAKLPNDVVVCIIPVYNVDGCLNRGRYSRANQNGPEEYGFRGNAQNLDLNRDFVKADAGNTQAFIEIFQTWKPDVFIDTHTSNGADYQYVMTLISTQRDKLHPVLSKYMYGEMVPQLYAKMKQRKFEMAPYVHTLGETPESGIESYMETPRYSTGYAALFNTLGFVAETHMWKPYNERVWATYELLVSLTELTQKDAVRIGKLKAEANDKIKASREYVLNWKLDTTRFTMIPFKGYEATKKPSEISGQQRLFYDRKKPFTRNVKFYEYYKPTQIAIAPAAYIVPQAWSKVIDRLKWSGVAMKRLAKDTSISCGVYYIANFETGGRPYEGHYVHSNTQVRSETQTLQFFKGDYVVVTDQAANRYAVETLEPGGDDSFFAWGFFDAVLQQKEWFSDYIFEEKAVELLKNDYKLKEELEQKKKEDAKFASNHWAQLYLIYQRSPYYERSHNRYPVGRFNGAPQNLPLE